MLIREILARMPSHGKMHYHSFFFGPRRLTSIRRNNTVDGGRALFYLAQKQEAAYPEPPEIMLSVSSRPLRIRCTGASGSLHPFPLTR